MMKMTALVLLLFLLPQISSSQDPIYVFSEKSRLLNVKPVDGGFMLILKPGQRLRQSLEDLQLQYNIQSGSIEGIGSIRNVEVAFFDSKKKQFVKKKFPQDAELLSLSGNLSRKEGRPWVHGHVIFADKDFKVWGGHLEEAEVRVTAEIVVKTSKTELLRERSSDLNSDLIR